MQAQCILIGPPRAVSRIRNRRLRAFYYLGNIMIEALKSDDIVNKVGGRFKLTALIQRRLAEIIDGARPLVERDGRSDLELVIEEIRQDKITVGWKDEEDDDAS